MLLVARLERLLHGMTSGNEGAEERSMEVADSSLAIPPQRKAADQGQQGRQ
jgi:hypothetical protein